MTAVSRYISLALLSLGLSFCQDNPSSIEARNYVIEASVGKDSAINELIRPYKERLDSTMDVIVGRSKMKMETARPEGTLGNLIADLVMEQSVEWAEMEGSESPDMVVLNNGGLRQPLPEGDISKRRIFQLMPFENIVEVVELEGEAMKELFAYLARTPQPIAGASLKIEDETPVERRVGGVPFDPSERYRVASSDFLIEGGDGMTFFSKAVKRRSTGIKLRDMILEGIRERSGKGELLEASIEGRIRKKEEGA